MTKVRREIADPKTHKDFMSSNVEGGMPINKSKDNLIDKWVYIAEIRGFTFQFASIEQVKECKAYFDKKIHPSTRGIHPPYEHYWHQWYCKLPKGIKSGVNRQKVIKSLNTILGKWA